LWGYYRAHSYLTAVPGSIGYSLPLPGILPRLLNPSLSPPSLHRSLTFECPDWDNRIRVGKSPSLAGDGGRSKGLADSLMRQLEQREVRRQLVRVGVTPVCERESARAGGGVCACVCV